MGNYRKYVIEYTETAIQDLRKHIKAGDKSTLNKITKLIRELEEHPFEGTGQPEALKHNMRGYWSRRINHKDRLVYKVIENIVTVEIFTAIGHYSDK
jgi:toxin YoeB